LTLIAIHVAAAVFAELQEGGGIISAMFTGRKISARAPVDAAQITAATVQSREEPPHRS
jgi:hypothetical protein